MTQLSHEDIETLWVQMGGLKSHADMAAAIAQAESGGVVEQTSPPNNDQWGSKDIGLFQINNHWHPTFAQYQLSVNVKGAIAISAEGASWRAWCTAWSDNACGSKGGTYLGSGAAFHQYITGKYTDTGIRIKTLPDGSEVLVDKNGNNVSNVQSESPGGNPGAGVTSPDAGAGGNAEPGLHIGNPLGWAAALAKVLGNLLDAKFWLRIGQGLAATVLLLIGLGLMFRKDIAGAAVSAFMPEAKLATSAAK